MVSLHTDLEKKQGRELLVGILVSCMFIAFHIIAILYQAKRIS